MEKQKAGGNFFHVFDRQYASWPVKSLWAALNNPSFLLSDVRESGWENPTIDVFNVLKDLTQEEINYLGLFQTEFDGNVYRPSFYSKQVVYLRYPFGEEFKDLVLRCYNRATCPGEIINYTENFKKTLVGTLY